jgi:2-keto-4-pentenoate hydratase/2-oxohepta-3-ene-1,7-dioic acid hydratase in catechol pathway
MAAPRCAGLLPHVARIPAASRRGMCDGDMCEIDIEGVGTLRNPIADEPA